MLALDSYLTLFCLLGIGVVAIVLLVRRNNISGRKRFLAARLSEAQVAFACQLPHTGPIGGESQLGMGLVVAKSVRYGIVWCQDGKLTLDAEEGVQGLRSQLISIPKENVSLVIGRPWRRSGYIMTLILRTLALAVAMAGLMAVAMLSSSKFDPLLVIFAAGGGVAFAMLIVFIPGILHALKKRTSVLFRAEGDQCFVVLIRPDEAAKVKTDLIAAGFKVDFA